jgi:hypothetical protein
MTPEEEKKAARKKRRGRGENFSLWLSPEQKISLLDRTRVSGAPSPSAFIKHRVFGSDFSPSYRGPVVKADPALVRQLSWIGNNVNQIARACNRSRQLSPEQAVSIYASLALIAEELELLSKMARQ